MKLTLTKHLLPVFALLLASATGFAQFTPLEIAQEYVRNNHQDWNLTNQDVSDMVVSDMYTGQSTGITRVYFLQRHQGIPVYNAITNLSITKDGKVFHAGKRFVQDLASKVNTTIPVFSAEDAVQKVMAQLGLPAETLRAVTQENENEFIFEKGSIARENISVKLRYQRYQGEFVLLSWDITLFPVNSDDMWSTRVDAVTGDILDEANWTVYCEVDGRSFKHVDDACETEAASNRNAVTFGFSMLDSAAYNVWPPPYESPNHGPRTMVADPADTLASPFGWHDTDGLDGPEFTITRGNNVHAYEDRDGDGETLNNEPDGGAELLFDFPYDPDWEPQQIVDAATVNLFFWNNILHDFAYSYGMNEAAGAFQDNNYGNGGNGNDHVLARAQAGADTGSANNANFGTPPDGGNGTMNMFIWTTSATRFLTVDEPASIAGEYDTGVPGTNWGQGAYVTDVPVSGEVVIVDDAVEEPYASDGCEDIVNASELEGKIALIDRGGCEFGFKTVQAQNAGAIGVIICNFADETITMGAGAVGVDANIPVVFISVVDCQTIRQFAGNGLNITLVDPGQTGPNALDGDLDNGIIAHEFGHGISNRLTGGPNNTGCLGNAEQMGEGWSDWFSLVTTVQPSDTGTQKRGVGTFATRQPTDGVGIRRYPYSTDMNISPLTYGDVAGNTQVHALGEVWANMVWDLYWAFVEEYGWDAGLYNGTGGNNMAMRLVFEGLKTQPCSPGFLDGRDAIIAADEALFGGANQCLIWEVFARRGAGYSAVQGESDNAADQTEAFDLLPVCLNAMTIHKEVTDFIIAGDDIEVTIKAGNFKPETVTGVVVTDEMPDGTSFKAGSSNVPATVSGNTVSFELGNMAFTQEETITYTLESSPDNFSIRHFLDDVADEISDQNWDFYDIGTPDATTLWQIDNIFANSGEWAWYIEDVETEARMGLELLVPWTVTGDQPVLRFYHMYDTEPGADGGVVDVKEVGTTTWQQVGEKMLRGGYPGFIQYGTFVVPNLLAFSGSSNNEFIGTYVDLSEWAGKDIIMRYRFGTDDNTPGPLGWIVDDVEYMDLLNYNGEACVTSNQGDQECIIALEHGTIVESQLATGTVDRLEDVEVAVFPNPAKNVLNVALNSENQQDVSISIITVGGKEVMARSVNLYGNDFVSLNVGEIPSGFYFVKVSTNKGVLVQKVIIE
jgi:extracellular elastinolytic metalloproteinase